MTLFFKEIIASLAFLGLLASAPTAWAAGFNLGPYTCVGIGPEAPAEVFSVKWILDENNSKTMPFNLRITPRENSRVIKSEMVLESAEPAQLAVQGDPETVNFFIFGGAVTPESKATFIVDEKTGISSRLNSFTLRLTHNGIKMSASCNAERIAE